MSSRSTQGDFVDSIHCGDSTETLKEIPSDVFDLVVTSPPYYLQRQYNDDRQGLGQEKSLDAYLDALIPTLSECVRILKPSGNLVYNLGDKYLNGSLTLIPHRFALKAIDLLNLQLINEITWVKSNPTPTQFHRRLVSSTEPFFHFALSKRYFYNRDDFLRSLDQPVRNKPTPRLGSRYRKLIDQSDRLTTQQKKVAHEELDKTIEEVESGEIQGFRMKISGVHAEAFGGQEGGRKRQMDRKGFTIIRLTGRRIKRDVIKSKVENLKGNKHTAIYPLRIIRELIRLLCPSDGLVLDPYVGSGTSAVAALLEGRHYLGIDIDEKYCAAARERISLATG